MPGTLRACACALALALVAASGAAAASDLDGDALPDAWETAPTAQSPAPPSSGAPPARGRSVRCTRRQRLRRGRCVPRPRCRRGRTLRRGRCVRRRRASAQRRGRRRRARARAAVAPANLAPLGADPRRKDVFVQIDYANAGMRAAVACGELDAIVAAYASAPVGNPDGTTGIDLHLDAGVVCPSRSYDLGGSRVFDAGACPDSNQTFQRLQVPESRIGAFHVAGFSPTCGQTGAAGVADLHGTRLMVFTDGPSFAHVLMHELGHNLGLDHAFPGQPNRISSMNAHLYASDDGNGSQEVLDYQRFALPALDENALSEVAGIFAPPEAHRFYVLHHCAGRGWASAWPGDGSIDWNCNSPAPLPPGGRPTIDLGVHAVDVNDDGQLTVFPATGEEWSTLDYASGGQIGP